MVSTLTFARQFLRRPGRVGAVAPSSPTLGRTMTAWPRLEQADVVVEFGPGTGALTPHILARMRPDAIFFALELDRSLCATFRRRFPRVRVHCDTVANVAKYLHAYGATAADCIVSGLPWAAFTRAHREELLGTTVAALSKGGRFVTFAYVHALVLASAISFRLALSRHFSAVTTSRVVWWNLPPAIVYQCVK